MEEIKFATFKPIINSWDDQRSEIRDYYAQNGLNPDTGYLNKYLENDINPIHVNTGDNSPLDIKSILSKYTPVQTFDSNTNTNEVIPTGLTKKAKYAINYLSGRGLSKEQAAGIVGNLHAESGLDPGIQEKGGGVGYGIAQWSPDRQQTFKRIIGKDIHGSNLDDQLKFIDWELHNTETSALKELLKTNNPTDAARAFGHGFERMKKYNKLREDSANKFYNS